RWHASCSSRSGALSRLARPWRASSCARQAERPPGRASYLFGARAGVQRGLLIDDPRWREPARDLAQNADGENGARRPELAADAHDCIMVRIQTDLPHTSVRREDAPNGELPSDDHADINRRHQTLKLRKGPSRGSSSLRVLRPQGTETQATLGGKPPSSASV